MKFKDKINTETFLQNFILDNCSLILLVVGILNSEDEKIINYLNLESKKENI